MGTAVGRDKNSGYSKEYATYSNLLTGGSLAAFILSIPTPEEFLRQFKGRKCETSKRQFYPKGVLAGLYLSGCTKL